MSVDSRISVGANMFLAPKPASENVRGLNLLSSANTFKCASFMEKIAHGETGDCIFRYSWTPQWRQDSYCVQKAIVIPALMRGTPLPRPSGVRDASLSRSSYPRTTLSDNGEHLQVTEMLWAEDWRNKDWRFCPFQPQPRWTQKAHQICPEKCNQISFSAFSRIGLHQDCLHPQRGESFLKAALHVCYCCSCNSDHRVSRHRTAVQGHKAFTSL